MDICHALSMGDLIEEINSSKPEGALIPFPLDDTEERDFCVLVSRSEEVSDIEEPAYYVCLVHQSEENPENIFHKTWCELEYESGMDFRSLIP